MTPPLAVFPPALAAGAAAAAVGLPLLVHLLFRKRYQVVPWAAVRFLLAAERRHRRRIDRWLLLTLRVLALLLPLFAMVATSRWAEDLWQAVRPGEPDTVSTTPRTHHILVVDASLSMTAKAEDGRTRFEHAVGTAEKLVQNANTGDGFTLIVLGNTVQPVIPGPANEPDRVVAEIRRLRPTHAPADAAAVLREVAATVARSPRAYPRRQVTVFADLQRGTWAGTLPKEGAVPPDTWQRIADRADLAVVDTARFDADNLAVVDLALADPLPLADVPAAVTATVRNYGRTERRAVAVELRLGRPKPDAPGEFQWDLPLAALVDAIPAGGQAAVVIPVATPNRPWGRGTHVIHARLKDPDALPADDNRYLVVEVRDGINVVLVDGNPTPREPLDRAAEYLDRALAPPLARPGQSPFRPRTLTPAEFADPGVGSLFGVDCVFLCDVGAVNEDLALKLEGHLKRGGGVVVGMGPAAAAGAAAYNRWLFRAGKGLLPVKLDRVVGDPDDRFAPGFRLHAPGDTADAFRQPPLADFQEDAARAGLTTVPFRAYLRMTRPRLDDAGNEHGEDEGDGGARRVLVFVPGDAAGGGLAGALARAVAATKPGGEAGHRADPALLEWPRHRGRVVVYAGTFNQDWTSWPVWRSYVPFCQQLARFAAVGPDRHTVVVGKPVQEFFPPAAAGKTAKIFRPGEKPDDDPPVVAVVLQDEAGEVTFPDTTVSGLYRVTVDGYPERVFGVNVADGGPGGSESDLTRVEPAELKAVGVPVQVVADPGEVRPFGDAKGTYVAATPRPWGPMVARFAVMAALLVLAAEVALAWRLGPARAPGAGTAAGAARAAERHPVLRTAGTLLALVPLAAAGVVLGTVFHAEATGHFLGFLPPEWRHPLEAAAGVPAAAPGEGTKWRLEGFTAFVRDAVTDRRLLVGLAAAAVVLTGAVYRLDRRAVGPWRRLVVPAALRVGAFLLLLFVLLGQLQWAFDREGWPEVVILLDTSGSMGTVDDLSDPAVRAKADELCRAAKLRPTDATRLRLAHLLLTHQDANGADWFDRLVKDRQVRVTVYSLDRDLDRITGLEEEGDLAPARKELRGRVAPDGQPPKLGTESRLGEGVLKALARHKGGSLAGIVLATDGVTTAGDDLPKAAREAARAGVPLYLIGTGDPWEAPDLELSDPQVEDVVNRDDRLVFQARLTARGLPPTPVPVILYEKDEKAGGRLVERARTTLVPGPASSPAAVTVSHTPTETGEKVYVLEVPARPEEPNKANNLIERRVQVTEVRKARVLYVEGYPRYEFRFLKTLLEREATRTAGRTVDLKVILLDAPREWAETDRSALPDFPTRDQLFDGYDVVVLGDFDPKPKDADPKRVPVPPRVMQDVADFVKVRGGGLLFVAGEHASPARFADTPLAEVLPVVPSSDTPPRPTPEDQPVTDGYRPRLTDTGRRHPLFRFAPDDGESARAWSRLQPLLWYARGYARKPAAEVLAVHPTHPAEGAGRDARGRENHPLVLQQFVGAGRVLFFGFDETWRWRFRTDEEQFNRFWVQAVRALARTRPERVRLRTDKEAAYRRGERMTVIAEFPAEAAAPPGEVRVKLERAPLTNPDGSAGPGVADALDLTLAKVEGTRRYEAVLPRTPEGEYRFVLTDPVVPGEPPRVEAKVLPPPTELERLDLDRPALAGAADLSRGRFYTLATADEFFKDLKDPPRVPLNQPAPPVPLWNHPGMFGLVLALFAAEWLLRKRERLL